MADLRRSHEHAAAKRDAVVIPVKTFWGQRKTRERCTTKREAMGEDVLVNQNIGLCLHTAFIATKHILFATFQLSGLHL